MAIPIWIRQRIDSNDRCRLTVTPKILIVDDEPRMRESLKLLLDTRGYDINTVNCGQEALENFPGKNYDLVLLDMFLGDMTGFQVMEFIHEHDPDALVIIITGDASIESAVEALKRGAYNYLKKPFEPEELLNTAEKALDHKRVEGDRRRVSKALKESEQRFKRLVEGALIGIAILQDDRVVYQNPEQKKIFGPLPKNFHVNEYRWIHKDDRDKAARALTGIQAGKAARAEIDFRFYPPSGNGARSEMRWVQCRASRFNYRGKRAALLNIMDITRARELERLVLTKSKLLSLGRIAAGMAHEIRNPLTGINSYLYSLGNLCEGDELEGAELSEIRLIIDQIQTASNKIEAVIKRVLDFSRPSHLRKIDMDINNSLTDAIDLSSVTLRKSGIKIEKDLESGLPMCSADPGLIEQVILNLINNAAQALLVYEGDRKIRVSSFRNDGNISVAVSDSGPGVPAELRDVIFDPFYTTRNDGSGIGLSIAQRIVTDHNGAIHVGTSDWGGAEFRVELPFSRDKIQA